MAGARTALVRAYFLLVATAGAAAVLAVEVIAARTLAPRFGSGVASWSALLAVALGSLAAGNLLGGLLGDRLPVSSVLCWALAAAAGALVAVAAAYPAAMDLASAQPGFWWGPLAAAALTQTVPMGLVGAVTPALVSAGGGHARRSRWAGAVLAAGSAGGILGALAAGWALLPALGLCRAYLAVAMLLSVVALPGAIAYRRWWAGLVLLAAAGATVYVWTRPDERDVIQSAYGQIEVRRDERGTALYVDGLMQTGLCGPVEPGEPLRRLYLLELALSLGRQPRHALVVGLGAGLAPRLLEAHGLRCESVEIDPAVVEAARREFGFAGRVHVDDGRRFLARTDRTWDLIFLDVCTSERLAWHLFTVEAMRLVCRRLAPRGVLVIQFIGADGVWSASVIRTVAHVFGRPACLAAAGTQGTVGPRWVFASPRPLPPLPGVREGAPSAAPRPATPEAMLPWRVVRPRTRGELCTDDHFPPEIAWYRVAARWRALHGGR